MAVGRAAGAPGAVGGAVGVLDEVGHVLRRLVHVERGNAQETGRLAQEDRLPRGPGDAPERVARG